MYKFRQFQSRKHAGCDIACHTETMSWGLFSVKHVVLIIILFFVFVGNATLLIVIATKKKLHTVTNAFVLSLAAAGLVSVPSVSLYIAAETLGSVTWECLGVMCLGSFYQVTSIVTLLATSFERYIHLVHPFFHRKHMTTKCVKFSLICVWMYSLLFASIPLMGWNALQYNHLWPSNATVELGIQNCRFDSVLVGQYIGILHLLHIVPTVTILPFFNIHILLTVRKFKKRRDKRKRRHACVAFPYSPAYQQQVSAGSPVLISMGNLSVSNDNLSIDLDRNEISGISISIDMSSTQMPDQRHKADTKGNTHHTTHKHQSGSRRFLCLMMLYFVISWFPTLIWYAVLLKGWSRTITMPEDFRQMPLPREFYYVAVCLGLATSAINPCMFGLTDQSIRMELINLLKKFKCKVTDG